MKRFMLGVAAITGVLSAAALFIGVVNAQSFRTGNNITFGQSEKINQTIYAAGRTIDINSEVFGDVICAGQNVNVAGTIHGDVICAGQNVTVHGTVDGDVRLAGQTVSVDAKITGNATIAGQNFNLLSTGSVGGDISVGSADATLNGKVGRDLAAASSSLTIANSVGRNLKVTVENLTLANGANITGTVDYTSNNELSKAAAAKVGGKITKHEPAKKGEPKRGAVFGFALGWFVYWFLAMLLTAMAIALLFPRMLRAVTDKSLPFPWKAMLIGLLASLLMPVVFILLAITVVGIPLAFIFILSWFVLMILSGPVFGYYLGKVILRRPRNALLTMLVGATVLLVLYFIPIIGFIALLVAFWAGMGMLLMELFKRTPRPEYSSEVIGAGSRGRTKNIKIK